MNNIKINPKIKCKNRPQSVSKIKEIDLLKQILLLGQKVNNVQ